MDIQISVYPKTDYFATGKGTQGAKYVAIEKRSLLAKIDPELWQWFAVHVVEVGKTKAEIIEDLLRQYRERICSTPQRRRKEDREYDESKEKYSGGNGRSDN